MSHIEHIMNNYTCIACTRAKNGIRAWLRSNVGIFKNGFSSDTRWVQVEDARVRMEDAEMEGLVPSGSKARKAFLEDLLKIEPYVQSNERQERSMPMRIINVNRTCKVTKGGGNFRFSSLVVVGNRRGGAGFGSGKGNEVPVAIDKAYARATKNLYHFDLYRSHTIFRRSEAEFLKTKVILMPAPSGTGIAANETIASICELVGIKDLRAKVIGSHHPHNTVKAVFLALGKIEQPETMAKRRGLVAVEDIAYG